MIEIQYVVALAMGISNVIKKSVKAELVPLITFALVILINIINALIFESSPSDAFASAFSAGLISSGLFVLGDMVRPASLTKR